MAAGHPVTAARAAQGTPERKRYAIRADVEGTIAQAGRAAGIRTARYLGLPKTTLEHNIAAAAATSCASTLGGPASL